MVYLCLYYIATIRLFSNPLFPTSVWSAVQLISWDLFTSPMCFIVIFRSQSKLELLIVQKEYWNASSQGQISTIFLPLDMLVKSPQYLCQQLFWQNWVAKLHFQVLKCWTDLKLNSLNIQTVKQVSGAQRHFHPPLSLWAGSKSKHSEKQVSQHLS